jgi:hypothetical protein
MPRARMQAIASLELRTQLRGAPFWTLLLIVVAATSTLNPVAMIRGGGETVDGVRAFANSVHALAPTFAMSAFFVYPFFVALMAGLTVLRDDEVGMTDLIGSSPVSTREYLVAKLAGVVAALLLALGVHLLVVMAFRELGVGGVARGPFSLASYVVPLVVLALPGVLWMAGLAFSLGAATRRPMLVYALPTALYVAQFALFWNWHPVGIAPWLDHTLMVLDPTGLRWLSHSLFAEDRGLGYYNTAPLALDATIVAGRLLTLMVPAAAVWALGVRRARRTDAPPSGAATAVTARPTRATFAPLGELRMQEPRPRVVYRAPHRAHRRVARTACAAGGVSLRARPPRHRHGGGRGRSGRLRPPAPHLGGATSRSAPSRSSRYSSASTSSSRWWR